MSRVIVGLKWARALNSRPGQIPENKPLKGRKAKGLKYEDEVGAVLPQSTQGQWFEFEDAGGHGFCQTDFLLRYKGSMVVLEVKYTWTKSALSQLHKLYVPIVEKVFGERPRGVIVCKRLVPGMKFESCETLREAIEEKKIWHYGGGIPSLADLT